LQFAESLGVLLHLLVTGGDSNAKWRNCAENLGKRRHCIMRKRHSQTRLALCNIRRYLATTFRRRSSVKNKYHIPPKKNDQLLADWHALVKCPPISGTNFSFPFPLIVIFGGLKKVFLHCRCPNLDIFSHLKRDPIAIVAFRSPPNIFG